MKMSTMVNILVKTFVIIIFISLIMLVFLYYNFNLKRTKIEDLTNSEIQEIIEITGIDYYDDLKVISFENRINSGDAYNVIKMPINNKSDILKTGVPERCDKLCDVSYFNENHKLYPYDCLYCRMFYDEKYIYLSFKNHAYKEGTKLMDYYYEIYLKRNG